MMRSTEPLDRNHDDDDHDDDDDTASTIRLKQGSHDSNPDIGDIAETGIEWFTF